MANIPSDIWHEITSYIRFGDVQALLACGSHAMSAKIVQSLKKVKVEVQLFDKFPFSAFNLPQIENLAMERMYNIPKCMLRLNGASILPSKPVTTLKRLDLDFAQSLSILAHTKPSFAPSALFPNLTSLCLSDCIGGIAFWMLQSLPEGLETLYIHPSPAGLKSGLTSSVFQYLPRNLQHLHLGLVEIAFKGGDLRLLPKSLKRLYLHSLIESSSDFIGDLPLLLEELDLSYECGDEDESPRFPVSKLPSSLRRIRCTGIRFTIDSPLPQQIENFECQFDDYTVFGEALLAYLPKSLTSLPQGIFSASLMANQFSERFPRVASISIWEKKTPVPFGTLFEQGLPPALTTFMAPHSLPTSDMRIRFPATLTHLKCFATVLWLKNLPSGLQSLDLQSSSSDPLNALKASDWSQLPSGLTHLSCTAAALGPPENLSLLRRLSALKSLTMTEVQLEWLEDPSVSLIWPQTLENMSIEGMKMQNMEWLSSLSSLTHLKKFSLSTSFDPSLGSSHLDKLPRGLFSLQIPWIPTEGFVGLPASLRALTITLYNADFYFTRFTGFPAKLQSLYVIGGKIDAMDPNVLLPLLPTGLSDFYISSLRYSERKEIMQRYYNHPKWGNILNALSVE